MKNHTGSLTRWAALPAIGLLLSACGGAAAAPTAPAPTVAPTSAPPTATASPVPPTATATPIPPTVTPSPTPDLTATAAAEATATAAPIIAMIDGELQKLGLSTETGHLGWVHREVTFELDSYLEDHAGVDYPDLTAADFVVHADITWETTTGLAGCGFLLRADPDFERGRQYQFAIVRLAGSPLWDIEYYQRGQFQYNLTSLRGAPALNEELGSTNRVTVVAQGSRFTAYANNQELGAVTDTKLNNGIVSFLAWQESGHTTCRFSDAWMWILRD